MGRKKKQKQSREDNERIARRLELTRLALGYDKAGGGQTKFLASLEPFMTVSLSRWNNYESGQQRITPDVALALKARHGVSLDWIYGGDRRHLSRELIDAIEQIERANRPAES